MHKTLTIKERMHPLQFRVMCDTFELPVKYTSTGNVLVKPLQQQHVDAVFGVENTMNEDESYVIKIVYPESLARALRPKISLIVKRRFNADGHLASEMSYLTVKCSWRAARRVAADSDIAAHTRAKRARQILEEYEDNGDQLPTI
jgi:hypothetical protein